LVPKFIRRHYAALIALAVYNFAVFFPVAFMGRVLSPNDVFYNFQPWASLQSEPVTPQNALLNDPPTAYYTIFSMVKRDWRLFHWNPYLAAGVPGFGSSASAVLSPFVLLPILLVPLEWTFTLMVFLKINAAFVFAYLWLREEHLGRRGAAVGAIVFAGAAVYAVRLLWQITSVTVLFPALLWITRRAFRGKPVPLAATTLIALAYALAGFPAAMAYGAYVVIAYAVVLTIRHRRIAWQPLIAVVVALMIAAPSLVPFAQFIRRSGYLEVRQTTSMAGVYPLDHWRNLIEPDRLGNPAYKNWTGDPRLGVLNNYVETTIYLGPLVLLLAIVGLFNRRARLKWFWAAGAVVLFLCMFGAPLIGPLVARLPGFKYSALARVALLLPLPIAYLAGAAFGVRWRSSRIVSLAAAAIAAYIAFDLGVVAGRFHPYLAPKDAHVPSTPTIEFLRAERGPFRVVPFFDYLWPNSAELFGIEDARSHFSSERDYRRLLQRLEPDVWSGQSTVLQFNALKYNFGDPLAGMLGVRYYLEHPNMDIIKWRTFAGTRPGVKETGVLRYGRGALLQRTIRVEDAYAIEIPARVEEGDGLLLTLMKDGRGVWSRNFTKADANVMDKLYVPVAAHRGQTLTLRIRSLNARGWLPSGENEAPGETKFYYATVHVPVVFERELPDGRVFRNLTELPRFWPVERARKMTKAEFLAAPDIDFGREVIGPIGPIGPIGRIGPIRPISSARVTLQRYQPHEQRVLTDSAQPFFLASSEKLTPELRVTIDGEEATAVEINTLFAGVQVPAGRHEIVFSRRLARGWWWLAIVGAAAWLAIAAYELTSSLRRRSPDTRRAIATAA
jgi:hypothetical protein